MRINSEWLGSAEISPRKDVIAGEISTWKLIIHIGKYGVDDGGSIRVAWRSVSDWQTPQFTNPKKIGYTSVATTGQASLQASYAKFKRPFGNSVLINVTHGYLKEGDIVEVILGDRRNGSIGIEAQTFVERHHEWRIYLDACGTSRYELIPEYPIVTIAPSCPNEIQAVIPGTVTIGKSFEIGIRVLDEFGNPTPHYHGNVKLELHGVLGQIREAINFPETHDGVIKIKNCVIEQPGMWWVSIEDDVNHFYANSNPSLAKKAGEFNLYWGDAHGQNALTIGTGTLDDYYRYARDKALIDFTGWQGNDFEITSEAWNEVRQKTIEYNEEHKFLAFLGYEWSGITPLGGDHNIFFLNDEKTFHPSSNWSSLGKSQGNKEANPITELFQLYKDRRDVLIIPHVGGRYANFDYYNKNFIKVIEIHSHHGIFEWFAKDAMKRRMKVGFVAASDDHTCRQGLTYPLNGFGNSASRSFTVTSGYTGVWANRLEKEEIWKALSLRHCYASTTDRVLLKTNIEDFIMGDELDTSKGEVRLHVISAGRYAIENILVYDWDKKIQEFSFGDKSKNKIRIRWSGVTYRGRQKSADWSGMLAIENGSIIDARNYAIDCINQGIHVKTREYITWSSTTSGDYDGIILELQYNDSTMIHFQSAQGSVDVAVKDIFQKPRSWDMGEENLKLEMESAFIEYPENEELLHAYVEKTIPLKVDKGEHAFWVKVLQRNGNAAWSSPIFVNKE